MQQEDGFAEHVGNRALVLVVPLCRCAGRRAKACWAPWPGTTTRMTTRYSTLIAGRSSCRRTSGVWGVSMQCTKSRDCPLTVLGRTLCGNNVLVLGVLLRAGAPAGHQSSMGPGQELPRQLPASSMLSAGKVRALRLRSCMKLRSNMGWSAAGWSRSPMAFLCSAVHGCLTFDHFAPSFTRASLVLCATSDCSLS